MAASKGNGGGSPGLSFRAAIADEAPQIAALVQAAFRADDARPNWTCDRSLIKAYFVTAEEVLPEIVDADNVTLLAIDDVDGSLAGSINVVKRPNGRARFRRLAVDEGRHGQGIGRRLMDQAEDYSRRTWAIDRFELNALSTRAELVAWYERCGFRRTGVMTPLAKDLLRDMELPDGMFNLEMEKN